MLHESNQDKKHEDYLKIKQYGYIETLLDTLDVPVQAHGETMSLSARVEVALNLVKAGTIKDTVFSWPYNHLDSEPRL